MPTAPRSAKRRIPRPSPATAIALLALFVALGGPAEAARLINGKSIKKGTLPGSALKGGSVAGSKLTKGTVNSLRATPPNSVGPAQIVAGAVNGGHVADNSLQAVDIANAAIGAEELGPNTVQSDEVQDGLLGARDVGSFVGTVGVDFPSVDPGACAFQDVDVAAVAATNPPRTVADDIVVVTPPSQFPDDRMVLSAAPSAATKVRVRVCNLNGAGAVDLPAMTYRYISFDF